MKKALKILTKSAKETKKAGERLARKIKADRSRTSIKKSAFILSLEGELGAGKTTFTQGFAKGLGIKENPTSPTFVIMQVYSITPPNPPLVKGRSFRGPLLNKEGVAATGGKFIHIDAYRIISKDLKSLGWKELIQNKENIILVEWGNRIRQILPKNVLRIKFEHGKNSSKRTIKILK